MAKVSTISSSSSSSYYYTYTIAILLFTLPQSSISLPQSQQSKAPNNKKPCSAASAIFVFGDSTVDPGNNNYLATALKSNFPPYGRDFLGHLPTGRFTNGKLPTDFIASYLGVKDEVPPYLDWTLGVAELMTGVSFASAGSGFDPLTAQITGVIPVLHQLHYFKDYLVKIELLLGRKTSEDLIRRAVFVVSAGTNDFVANYFAFPFREQRFNVNDYQNFLLQNIREFLQGLEDLGARKIVVVGLPPMGCLPIVITLNSRAGYRHRGCIEAYNSIARGFNGKLQVELRYLQNSFASDGCRISYADIYRPVMNLILAPTKFGFEDVMNGCCGTGLIEAAILCNLKSIVCPDASKYVFWDSIHPTEKTYFIVFNSLQAALIDLTC